MQEVFTLINEMSPYLLLGFLLAGLMHAFIPGMVYSRYLSGHGFRSVLYGALFGIPLPLCSCGVIVLSIKLVIISCGKFSHLRWIIINNV